MRLDKKELNYFKTRLQRDEVFWQKFKGGKPDFKNKLCLDVGCGHGSLCINMALAGATEVVGIDINKGRIKFAKENLQQNFSELQNIIKYEEIDIGDFEDRTDFDFVISQASFEHIINLDEVFIEMIKKLKPFGKTYIGFGPLYNSLSGAHSVVKMAIGLDIPWGHKIIPERIILNKLNKKNNRKVNSIQELGLNKWSLKDFKNLILNSDLSVVYFKVNSSGKRISKLFTLASRIPFLREYFSFNIYCILQKV